MNKQIALFKSGEMKDINERKIFVPNQIGEQTCMEHGDLPGSETTGEKPRCSMGEGAYSPSHF